MILFVEYLRSWNEMYFALCMKNDLFQILPRQMLYLYGWTFGLSTSAVLSSCVGMLLLTKVEIMVHTKYFFQGLCEELFLKNWPYKHRGFYSSCGSIPMLALGGKPSSYERCHCYCIPDSKNFHFTIVQKYRLNCDAHSDTQVSYTK